MLRFFCDEPYTGSGGTGKIWTQGDFDADGDVDFGDFNTLANHYTGADVLYTGGSQRAGGGGGGERGLIAEMLARGYTPPAWLYDRWFDRLDSVQPDWLYEFEQDSGPADRGGASQQLVDHVMELLLTCPV